MPKPTKPRLQKDDAKLSEEGKKLDMKQLAGTFKSKKSTDELMKEIDE